ncbi:HD family phosphohydrolase [Bacillus sp. FJAT-47783]|uniref:HD family phosphohydrolase n=1 Tax=Bacillus sp. FJAT-47783 TaxID=2922712 RepID=UPI001FAB70EA|nr:HD family phosphohydrolase [Bacillus sp. FJAT-47783]
MKKNKKNIRVFNQIKSLHFLLYPVLSVILFVVLFSNVKPDTFDVKLFTVSDQTIYAPTTMVDEEMTKKRRDEAAANVEDQYVLNREFANNSVSMVNSIFETIMVKKTEVKEENEVNISEDEKLLQLQDALKSQGYEQIPADVLTTLLKADEKDLKMAVDSVITAVNTIMSNPITVEKVEEARANVKDNLQYGNLSNELVDAAAKIGEIAIIPNYTYDLEATEEKREQAREEVQEVQIKQGQIIVEEGQLIDREVYRKLDLLGLLDNKYTFQPFIGLALLILLMVALLAYYFEKEKSFYITRQQSLLLYTIIFSITLAMMKIISLFQEMDYTHIGFIVPVSMGVMLIKLLINDRLAFLSSLLLAVCGSLIFNDDVTSTFNFVIGLYYLCGCLAAVLFLGEHNVRAKILQSGLFVSFVNVFVITSIILIQNGNTTNLEIGSYFVMAVVSGIVSSVLAIGFMPFFESGFGILSTMKLIELSNPNHPLLRKILTEAPGTYHHSVMVANLAESACEAIGANGLLARVGSYYHDIGKTKRPHYFIENQMNMENPHDKLSAQLSKNVIIAHATEGAEMLRKYKMPKEFVDVAEQHHGTTLLKYFYHKAKENSEHDIMEEEFRYPGPKPQTREIAVISIADSVEAAVRSLKNPTPEKIEKLVQSIIKDRVQDGQFDECDITFKELDLVAKSLCETMKGIFHSRIEYPELNKKVKQV